MYRFYRFWTGGAYGACVGVGEVALIGYEVIDNNSSSYACSVTLNINGAILPLSGTVTYKGSLTPLLTSISPRFGNVVGGDTVTFTGINFNPISASYSI